MKIVIIGAGDVGRALARSLAEEGHDLTVIEQDEDRALQLEATADARVVRGDGARPGVLERAGITPGCDVDVLIGCADRDEVNLMAGWLAKRSGVKQVLTRARGMEFTDSPAWAKELGIDVMSSPERALSREIMSLLQVSAAVHSHELFDGRAGSFAFRVEAASPIRGRCLAEVGRANPQLSAIIVYVQRDDEGFVPDGSWRAMEGDLCFVVTTNEHALAVSRLFHRERERALGQVVIVGGGKLGAHLAGLLCQRGRGVHVLLVDRGVEKCAKLASEYPTVEVVQGDGFDPALLRDVGVPDCDGLVVTTDNDELNVMIAALGRSLGCRKTMAVVRDKTYDLLASHLPVDALINPHETLATIFLRHVRYPQTAGAMNLIDRIDAELAEVTLSDGSAHIGRAIKDLGLNRGVLIATINRRGHMLVPDGNVHLRADDTVCLFAKRADMPEAIRLMERRS